MNKNNTYLVVGNDYTAGISNLTLINVNEDGNVITSFGTNGYKTIPTGTGHIADFTSVSAVANKIYCNSSIQEYHYQLFTNYFR